MGYMLIIYAAIANIVIGMLWYSTFLFGKPWMKLVGLKKDFKPKMFPSMLGAIVSSLLIASTLSLFSTAFFIPSIVIAFYAWLGFVVTVSLNDVLWAQKPIGLYLINNSYYLVSFLIMGYIVGL